MIGAALGLAGCSAATTSSGGARQPASLPPVTAPLTASLTTDAATWAVVPMGHLDQSANTFWQVMVLPAHGPHWVLATPPGVADNTGLVDVQAGATFATGFEASQLLEFSPLALTSDTGTSWTQAVLSRGLAPVPDALAATNSGQLAALTDKASGAGVLDDGPMSWHRVLSARALAASPSGHRCGISGLTAVAYSANNRLLVGASCLRRGVVGIWSDTPNGWSLAGPSLPETQRAAMASVIRLRAHNGGVSALVSARGASQTALIETSLTGDEGWSWSSPLLLAPSDTLVSSGFGADGAAVVLLRRKGSDIAEVLDVGSRTWTELPEVPDHAAAIAFETDGAIDALVVDGAELTAYRLAATTSSWQAFQVLDVPIQYGSSS